MNPEQPSPKNELTSQFAEISYSLPEFIDFARGSGDEALATEFESYYRRHGEGISVRMLMPNDPDKSPAIELIYQDLDTES